MSQQNGPAVRGFGREIRWTVMIVVLTVVAAIALWLREDAQAPSGAKPAGEMGERSARASVMESEALLAPLRRQAALRPCPQAQGDHRDSGSLAGIGEIPVVGINV